MVPTVAWEDGVVVMIDQRRLPGEQVFLRCRDHHEVAAAIKDMAIRGAPAIGVAAALGLALGRAHDPQRGRRAPAPSGATCARRSPPPGPPRSTSSGRSSGCGGGSESLEPRGARRCAHGLLDEALAIQREDLEACRRMGDLGAELLPAEARVLTHCNAGALATAGYGTALGVIRSAARLGKVKAVFADETRPWLQGARLTAWELLQDGIPTTLIADNMAGPPDGPRRDRRGRGRRGPHRRQRRRRQQDRHLHRGRPRQGARHPLLRGGAGLDLRPRDPDRRRHPDRGAPGRGGHARGGTAHRPRGGRRPQPRLRRHAAPLRHGHRLRAGRRPAALTRRACARWPAPRRPAGR